MQFMKLWNKACMHGKFYYIVYIEPRKKVIKHGDLGFLFQTIFA